MTEKEYKDLKREVEDARNEANRAQGSLDALKTRLKDEFGCDSLREARTKLTELEAELEKAQKTFDKAAAEYQEKWKKPE